MTGLIALTSTGIHSRHLPATQLVTRLLYGTKAPLSTRKMIAFVLVAPSVHPDLVYRLSEPRFGGGAHLIGLKTAQRIG